MSEELAGRIKELLESAAIKAKKAEARTKDIHSLLELLVGNISDIELTVFNAWVFLIAPENMADAFRHISEENLAASVKMCDEQSLEKIKTAIENL